MTKFAEFPERVDILNFYYRVGLVRDHIHGLQRRLAAIQASLERDPPPQSPTASGATARRLWIDVLTGQSGFIYSACLETLLAEIVSLRPADALTLLLDVPTMAPDQPADA